MKQIAIIILDITKRAGTERAVCNLSNLLTESQKYSVFIISIHSISGEAAYNINDNIQIYHLGLPEYNNKIIRLQLYRKVIHHLKIICKKEKIDIIIGTSHGINSLLFLLEKKVKTIACEHLNYMSTPLCSRIIRRITYLFLDVIVVLTISDAKNYLFHKKVKIVPNSLSFIPNKQSVLNNKIILSVGRLSYEKGFDLLIQAISLIRNECDGWKVKIIGSGEDEDKLRKQIEKLNLDNLIKIYPQSNNIIQEYLNGSIFVLSSRYEGFGLVLIEAQSCGLPTISFDCLGPHEIIHHNEDGLLVENGNIYKLSTAILYLIQNKEKRIQFSKRAVVNVQKYRPENIFRLWDSLLSTL
jgi:glycosyltransferase involved in cell wall biosynthesis